MNGQTLPRENRITNPKKYDIDRRMTDPNSRTCWRVSGYRDEVKAGDLAFIWKSGPQRGIVALLTIDTDPQEMEEPEHERKYALDLDTGIMLRIDGTFVRRHLKLSHLDLRKIPELSDLSVFHGFQMTTNFRVTPQEGQQIMSLIGSSKS